MKKYAEKYQALADETRLRILYLLIHADAELCVCELTDALEIPQYNISRHLKILKNAGLVVERKEGRWVQFQIANRKTPLIESLLNSVRHLPASLLSKNVRELDKRLEIRENGKCLLGIQKKHLMGSQSKTELISGEKIK